ncbi:hypothetical protein F5X96DRAFT_311825 [Biscogniauxia mediterranea]|nr:hypothetical protein F5X96DRAFT_311825 [Biscogniauxia mediterranea]
MVIVFCLGVGVLLVVQLRVLMCFLDTASLLRKLQPSPQIDKIVGSLPLLECHCIINSPVVFLMMLDYGGYLGVSVIPPWFSLTSLNVLFLNKPEH